MASEHYKSIFICHVPFWQRSCSRVGGRSCPMGVQCEGPRGARRPFETSQHVVYDGCHILRLTPLPPTLREGGVTHQIVQCHGKRKSHIHERSSPNHECTSPTQELTPPTHARTSPTHKRTSPIHSRRAMSSYVSFQLIDQTIVA